MNVDPDVVSMVGNVLVMNVVVVLVLAVVSYAWSVWSLHALAALDRWLDPSSKARDRAGNPRS